MRFLGGLLVVTMVALAGCSGDPGSEGEELGEVSEELRGAKPIAFESFDDFAPSRTTPLRVVITSAAQYDAYVGHAPPVSINWSKEWVVFYAAGVQSTGGYAASIESIGASGRTLGVTTKLVRPGEGCMVTMALTNPQAFAKFDRPSPRPRYASYKRLFEDRDCSAPTGPTCGGIAALQCPGAGQCMENLNDSCDPNNGGADCGGICECNALGMCVQGFHWDPSPTVCGCVADTTPTTPRCGGIAGIQCPGAGQCVDDPNDSCDPQNGGADCGGVCECTALGMCVQGFRWDSSNAVCGCVPN